jgi:hypothetical protein
MDTRFLSQRFSFKNENKGFIVTCTWLANWHKITKISEYA